MTETDAQTPPPDDTRKDAYEAGKSAAHNRWLLLIVGGVTVIAGLLALAMPIIASLTAALLAGWVLILSGAAGLITAFRRRDGWALAAAFALSIVAILTGIMLLVQPVAGIFAIGTIIIGYFAAAGVLRLYYGLRAFGDGGGWLVATGALSLALAVMLWSGLPVSAAWVPGVMLGVDLLLWGAVQIALALRVGRTA